MKYYPGSKCGTVQKVVNFEYFATHGKDLDFLKEIDKIRLDIDLECNSSYKYELKYSIRRTDVWTGMYRE